MRAKSRPIYYPVRPYLTIGVDGMNLDMWTKLNGQFEQQGNTLLGSTGASTRDFGDDRGGCHGSLMRLHFAGGA